MRPDNITKGMDGEPWLNIHRKKTNKDYQVPLLPKAQEILNKYKNHPVCLRKGKCLAVPSKVKYSSYLKEIGDIAEIPKNKPLLTHLARRTFASTIAQSNGMNIGVLSKILKHNSIKVTLDSYGIIIDELMLRNVKELMEKLSMKKEEMTRNEKNELSQPHQDLISQIRNGSKN